MRALDAAAIAQGKALQLAVYRLVRRSFTLPAYPHVYRRDDAEDAWTCMVDFPSMHHAAK
jgi:hypothetical protein